MSHYANGGIRVPDLVIGQVAYNAGWRGQPLIESIARCYTESNYYADIINDQSDARGLWQILPAAHPEFKAELDSGAWMNPQTNANMAFSIYKASNGGSFQPWAADGTAWMVNIPLANGIVNQLQKQGFNVDVAGTTGASGNVSNPGTTSIDNSASAITNKTFWLRIAYFILGGVLVLYGLWELMKNTPTGSAIKSTAKTAIAIGK